MDIPVICIGAASISCIACCASACAFTIASVCACDCDCAGACVGVCVCACMCACASCTTCVNSLCICNMFFCDSPKLNLSIFCIVWIANDTIFDCASVCIVCISIIVCIVGALCIACIA